jgi:hypothetical protein
MFDTERLNLMKLNDAEVKEQNKFKCSKRFATLKNLDDNVNINRTYESTR